MSLSVSGHNLNRHFQAIVTSETFFSELAHCALTLLSDIAAFVLKRDVELQPTNLALTDAIAILR